jgi:hypothetical protein
VPVPLTLTLWWQHRQTIGVRRDCDYKLDLKYLYEMYAVNNEQELEMEEHSIGE